MEEVKLGTVIGDAPSAVHGACGGSGKLSRVDGGQLGEIESVRITSGANDDGVLSEAHDVMHRAFNELRSSWCAGDVAGGGWMIESRVEGSAVGNEVRKSISADL